jgi:hypothetical protein
MDKNLENNFKIQPVSPIIKSNEDYEKINNNEILDNDKTFFLADTYMLNRLVNDDFEGYIKYVRNKFIHEKYNVNPYVVEAEKIVEEQLKKALEEQRLQEEVERSYNIRNKMKKDLLDSILTNINNLENTLNKFGNTLDKYKKAIN